MAVRPSYSENKYFQMRESGQRQQLRDELTQKAEDLHNRERAPGGPGSDELGVRERISLLGFREETMPVFDLLPLICVSWADGKIQRAERTAIMELLVQRGVQPGEPAWMLTESLLELQPSDVFMNEALALLRDFCKLKGLSTTDVIELCFQVADASGSWLKPGSRVSKEEHDLIREIAALLGEDAQKNFAARL